MPTPSKSKHLGQHFLIDTHVLGQIGDLLRIQPCDKVIEIGAGDGALTEQLVESGAQITALEFDTRRIGPLRKRFRRAHNLHILEGNALTVRLSNLLAWPTPSNTPPTNTIGTTWMVGNLPYNIASQIIVRFAPEKAIDRMGFMLQQEMAERLAALPHSRQYGRLSLSVALWRDAELHLRIPKEAFDPPPQVVSSFVLLGPPRPLTHNLQHQKRYHSLVQQAFSQRRKQVGNALATIIGKEALSALGIDPSQRAEDLHPHDFLTIARAIENKAASG